MLEFECKFGFNSSLDVRLFLIVKARFLEPAEFVGGLVSLPPSYSIIGEVVVIELRDSSLNVSRCREWSLRLAGIYSSL